MNDELAYSIEVLIDRLKNTLKSTTDAELLENLENQVDSIQFMINFLRADMNSNNK